MGLDKKKILKLIYKRLFERFGPQKWWPGKTSLEIIVGAILTQNTAWTNVEKAINNLKKGKVLNLKRLLQLNISELASLIKPSGYYNIKAKRLKNLISFIFEKYSGKLKKMFEENTYRLRRNLLEVNGIGKETADSIILYAGNKPIFVIDAYTKRIFSHLGLIVKDSNYDEVQGFFMDNLEKDVRLFNEYHALLVNLGKNVCKVRPVCKDCPLKGVINGRCKKI